MISIPQSRRRSKAKVHSYVEKLANYEQVYNINKYTHLKTVLLPSDNLKDVYPVGSNQSPLILQQRLAEYDDCLSATSNL
jgi:hypothetical protein